MRRRFLLIVAVALAGAACSSTPTRSVATGTSVPASTVRPPTPTARASRATTTVARPPASTAVPAAVPHVREYGVGIHSATYVDATRPTAANGSYQGAPTRTLPVTFFAPIGRGPFPLILFSHGVDGAPRAFRRLLTD